MRGNKARSNRSNQSRLAHRAVCEALELRRMLHVDLDHPDHHDGGPLPEIISLPVNPVIKKTSAALTPHAGPLLSAKVAASIPALSSNEEATAQLYLDFNGAPATPWGSYTSAVTPAYDTDGDAGTFTEGELANIQNIWSRVSETYSPFNINVTTVDPGNLTDHVTTRVIIGGTGSWYGTAGGVAFLGAFYNSAPNIAWVFPKMLANGNVKYTADAIAHEAGHTFGLQHQSSFSGSSKTAEYNPGTSAKAPIMGNSYYAARSLWWKGPSSLGASSIQDDVAVISNSNNNFGYRADDHGGAINAATAMHVDDNIASASGIISQLTDKDYFSFSTLMGTVAFTVSPAAIGGMLDATLSLVTAAGAVLASANTASLGETISASVAAGQYFLVVASHGSVGDIGQYTLGGTIVTSPNFVAAPAGLTAAASNGQVSLHWTDMSWNETGFQIERSGDGGSNWDLVTTAAAAATTYTDSSASVGTSYQYRLRANGESENSDYSGTATVNVIPAVPTGLAVTSVSATQIDVAWNDVTGESGYRLERSSNNSTWVALATLGADETDYSSTAIASGTRYYYRVVALSGVGNSAATASVNTYTRPAAPSTVTGTPTATAMTVIWTNVTGESGYRVERSLDGSDWAQIATTAVNVVSYTNTGLTPNSTYYYRITAYNPGGNAVVSGTLQKKTLLPAPTGLAAAVQGMNQINLSWTDSEGEANYRVERLIGTVWTQVGELLDPDQTSLSVTGLVAGTSYSFRIRAYNESGASSPSTAVAAVTIPPAPATITAAALSTSQIKVSWANVAGETGFKVERSPDGSDWTQVASTAANAVTYTDTLLSTDTVYYYRAKPYNVAGTGDATTTASTRTLLSAPTGLAATVVSTSQIDLAWDNSTGETGYRLERLSGTSWVQVGANLSEDVTEQSVTGLIAGTAYSFRVRAINSGGISLPGTAATATTIPAMPVLTATALSDTQIRLNWTNVAGESGYKIERSPDDSDWSQIATTAANAITVTDSSLSSDTTYYYRVRAWNNAGNGAYSASVSRRTLLPAPTGVTAEATSATGITVSWDDSTAETGYRVERLSGTTWVQVGAVLAADVTSVAVSGLVGGTTYPFRVRAISSAGVSLQSATATALTRPAAPATIATTSPAAGQIKLTWANVAGELGFKIERSLDGSDWSQIGAVGVNILTYTDSGLSSGAYYYRIKAYNASGDSAPGPTATRTI